MLPLPRHTPLALALALIGQCASAAGPVIAPTVVITGTRIEQNSFDLPMAIDSVSQETIQEQRATVNLSEVINRVPGVMSAGKENYAQEQSLTIRGFGARSQFGVRGIKLLADGIPASTPDGQGGTGLFDLSSASRIEVLRGPFSSLYGNHSGGVVQVFTEDAPERFTITPSFQAGSDSTTRYGLKFGDTLGNFGYTASVSRFDSDGYRDYSNSNKEQANFKARWLLGDKSTLTVVGNYLKQDGVEDPLGLDISQLDGDRRQQGTAALSGANGSQTAEYFGTRRTLENTQGGAVFETALSDRDTLRAMFYAGNRNNEQFLAINSFVQNRVTGNGGVSVYDRDYWGTNLRWTRKLDTLTFSVGAEYERADEDRKGYRNGATVANDNGGAANYGTRGALKRNETNIAEQSGVFAQAEWALMPDFSLSGGIRYTRVDFESDDHFICNGACSGSTLAGVNPDDSGSANYSDWTSTVGAVYKLTPTTNLYANAGQSFEAPTLIELAYREDNQTGLNFDLKPSTSMQYELGVKSYLNDSTRLDVSAFYIASEKEIVTRSNENGRVVYQNAGDTSRKGVELSIDSRITESLGAYAALTLLDAKFDDAFTTCMEARCPSAVAPEAVASGNKIAGVANKSFYGEVTWRHEPAGFSGAVEYRASGRMFANDTNTVRVGGYGVAAIRGGFSQKVGGWKFSEFARIDNLFDKEYVGSIYINAGDTLTGRYYAPAAERTWLIGVSAAYTL
jgi:iron complex outermembrane recepter protein